MIFFNDLAYILFVNKIRPKNKQYFKKHKLNLKILNNVYYQKSYAHEWISAK